ncbi:MAG: 1-acyl-sn-glycerol-3-phosphate acyltransferase [Tahibacter sp.]
MNPLPTPAQLAPAAPRSPDNAWRRFLRWFITRNGWKLVGEFPDVARLVIVAAPHSSWWDGWWGLMFKVAIGLDASFMGKRELFFWPLGWLLRGIGGIPVERSSASGVVTQMVARFTQRERLWLALAPEGTRRKVTKWRSGFWNIAHAAGVPVLAVYFHYPEKTIGVGPLFHLTDDMSADIARIRAWYAPWKGRNRGTE